MALSFQELIRFILDGQNVDAATINRVLRDLDNNTRYVRDMFDAALSAEALFDREVTCEDALLVGMPAYFNAATGRFERAKAVTYFDDGLMKIGESSYPWGIVSHKYNTTKCDLLICGVAAFDISAALNPADIDDGEPIPGVYYLSGSEAGKMQRLAAPVSVPVCQVGPDHSVNVRLNLADVFTRHIHFQHALVCRPAGTASLGGGRWSIPTPDPDLEGWLPADHAIFDGKAPGGAVYGYNLAQSSLGAIWPPLPLEGVYVAWDRGVSKDVAATGVPLGPYGLVTVDEYGIWWNSDVDLDVPWPADINTTTTTPPPPSVPPESPRLLEMRLAIYFTKPVYQTTDTVVTSLVPGSPLVTIACATDGTPAATGPLVIDLDINLLVDAHGDLTPIALKTLAADGSMSDGPVVVGIKGAGNLSIATEPVDQPEIPGGYKFGLMTITGVQTPLGGELPVVEVKLDGATLENYKNIMSLGLLKDRDSSFRGEYHIPKALGGLTNTKVRLWLLGRGDGNLPDMTLTARVIDQPGALPATVALPLTDSVVALDTSHAITTDKYLEVESAVIPAMPGASIQFTLTREAQDGDGYDFDVLVLKRLAVIVA